MPLTITIQKDLKNDLTSQKTTSLNQTNDHLDVQVYVQIRVTRHSLQTQSSRHSQIRTKHNQFSAKAGRTIKTNHLEIRLISSAVTVIVEQQLTNSCPRFQLARAFFSKNGSKNDARQVPTIIIYPSLQIEDKRFKNSVNPG